MSKSRVFLIFEITFLISIVFVHFLCGEFINLFFLICFIIALLAWFKDKINFDKKVAIIVFVAVALGFLRCIISFEGKKEVFVNYFGKGEFEGCVVDEPDVREDKVKYVLEISVGKILVSLPKYPVYRYGDCLVVSGRLEKPGKIEDFDYGGYLRRYGIYAVIYDGAVVKIKGISNNFLSLKSIYFLKNIFAERLKILFSEPSAGFMGGLILGSRSAISTDLMDDFNKTGLTHIVAISGYNITMLINILASLLFFLRRKTRIFISCVFVILFVFFVGAGSSVVRAGIMGVIGLISLWFGRQYYADFCLITALFIMVLWNPFVLTDVGLQLSFLATAGLIHVSPFIKKFFLWAPEAFGLREALCMTISAQITSIPIIIYNFGRLSIISPFANLIVLPFIPFIMLFGFLAVISSFFAMIFGEILSFVGVFLSEIVFYFVRFFADFPFSSIGIGEISCLFLFIYYSFVLRWVIRKYLFHKGDL